MSFIYIFALILFYYFILLHLIFYYCYCPIDLIFRAREGILPEEGDVSGSLIASISERSEFQLVCILEPVIWEVFLLP